jgi:hypothetical protein
MKRLRQGRLTQRSAIQMNAPSRNADGLSHLPGVHKTVDNNSSRIAENLL